MRKISVVNLITVACFLVYLFWFVSETDHSLRVTMEENFLVSWEHLLDHRYWVLLTAAFSHNLFWHFFINIYALRSFGGIVESILGSSRFLTFYIFAAAFSSFVHAAVSFLLIGDPAKSALGASGALSAIILFFVLVYPRERIYLLGVIPLPAYLGAALFIILDLWGLVSQVHGGGLPIGHGAHLGGAVAGIIYFYYLKWSNSRKYQRG